jgi:peroxiredoxin
MPLKHLSNACLGLVALGATLLCLTGCGGGSESIGEEFEFSVLQRGDGAPDFSLEAVGGSQVNLSDLEGQVRLIDFWATWCAPCREEIPMFKELYAAYGSRGFTILAISDESLDAVSDFVESHDIPYPNLVDPGEVSEEYGVLALPSAYLVDRDGKVIETFVGPKPREVLEGKIVELLERQPAT